MGRSWLRSSPLYSLRSLWVWVLLGLLLAALLVQPIYQPDFWWHVRVGEVVLETGQVPQVDLFSYTVPGQPYVYQGWLAGVWLAQLYRAGGAGLVIVANALLLTAAYALLLWHCRRLGGSTRLAVGATFAALAVSAGNWAVRPQTFSVLLFVALYVVVDRFRLGWKSPLWVIPPVLALWANLHGAFVTGLAVLALVLLVEGAKRIWPGRPFPAMPWRRLGGLALAAALAAAAVLANPVGPRIVGYVLGIWRNPAIRTYIAEWQPIGSEAGTSAIFLLSLAGYPLLCLWRRRRPDPTDLLLLLALAWLALGGVRNLLWYGLALAPLLARALAGPEEPPELPSRPALNGAIAALVVLLIVLALPWVKGALPLPAAVQGFYAQDTPVETAQAVLAQGLPGPIFHQMESGSYLLWRLWPVQRVFIDPRIELYPGAVWDDYFQLSAGRPGCEELLDRYGIQTLLLNRAHQGGLAARVDGSPQWERVYENAAEDTVVYRRRP